MDSRCEGEGKRRHTSDHRQKLKPSKARSYSTPATTSKMVALCPRCRVAEFTITIAARRESSTRAGRGCCCCHETALSNGFSVGTLLTAVVGKQQLLCFIVSHFFQLSNAGPSVMRSAPPPPTRYLPRNISAHLGQPSPPASRLSFEADATHASALCT